jgi:hypothetical protein
MATNVAPDNDERGSRQWYVFFLLFFTDYLILNRLRIHQQPPRCVTTGEGRAGKESSMVGARDVEDTSRALVYFSFLFLYITNDYLQLRSHNDSPGHPPTSPSKMLMTVANGEGEGDETYLHGFAVL